MCLNTPTYTVDWGLKGTVRSLLSPVYHPKEPVVNVEMNDTTCEGGKDRGRERGKGKDMGQRMGGRKVSRYCSS